MLELDLTFSDAIPVGLVLRLLTSSCRESRSMLAAPSICDVMVWKYATHLNSSSPSPLFKPCLDLSMSAATETLLRHAERFRNWLVFQVLHIFLQSDVSISYCQLRIAT